MKSIVSTFILILGHYYLFCQNIIHVNNAPGSTADYSDLQDAIDAALPEDLIYVYGSGISYGNITITKKVQIQGPGYLLGSNFGGIQNPSPAIINSLNLEQGCVNSYLSGLTISNFTKIDLAGLVLIEKCQFKRTLSLKNSSGISIRNCHFDPLNSFDGNYIDQGCSDIKYENNLIEFAYLDVDNRSSATFTNNILFGLKFSNAFIGVNNSIFKNNILIAVNNLNGSGNTFLRNIFIGNSLVAPPGNINANENIVFLGYPNQGSYSPDGRFQLKPGSPAIGYGEGGTDCGIFGGPSPYVLSGLPSIPVIYEIAGPSTAPAGGNLNVTIKARIEN